MSTFVPLLIAVTTVGATVSAVVLIVVIASERTIAHECQPPVLDERSDIWKCWCGAWWRVSRVTSSWVRM